MRILFGGGAFAILISFVSVGQMNPQYDTYTTWSYDGNTTVTATVVVEGTTTGSCNGIPGCSSATHTIKFANQIGGSFNPNPSSADWITGPSGSVFSYLSGTHTGSATISPGQQIQAWEGGQVWCTFLGAPSFYNFPSIYISLKTTYGQNTLGSQVIGNTRFCGYTPACSNNVIPACGNPSWTDSRPSYLQCTQYLKGNFLKVTVGGSYVCFAFDTDAFGPGPCDP